MKSIYKYLNNILSTRLTLLILFVGIIASCTDDMSEVRLDPKLATSQVINIGSDSATVVGFVVAEGQGFLQKGICYSTTTEPDTTDSKMVYTGFDESATFKVKVTGLNYATKYYARAYAYNDNVVVYGDEITFTTLPVIPTVTTTEFVATSGTKATGGGNVTNDGGAEVTERGVVYSTEPSPTIDNDLVASGEGNGEFEAELTNLRGLTTYYVRAYATNSAGTAYGQEVSFETPKSIVTLWVAGDFQGWNPGDATDSLMNSEEDPIVQGYVYIPNTNGFKFVSQKNWDGPNYGLGAAEGELSDDAGAGNVSVSEPGYYWFQLDLDNMTYTTTKTEWGVVGDATGSWDNDQDMAYSSHFKSWVNTITLSPGELKFRANDAWTINYGDTEANGTLVKDGANIVFTTTGTYSVILTLSNPVEYTYKITEWGLIGSATGGWDTDIDMTPNADNTWTLTTDLVAGEMKFRANDGWDINLGGTLDNLSWGAPNINVTEAGNYTITLDLNEGTATMVKN